MARLSGSGGGDAVPCDYCTHRPAVLICRADSAKLCLFCDHHVHSANALSQKHLRSQICDNCTTEPVSVRCATDNLMLCHHCDSDAHACSASHHRIHVDGFSGCPSAADLASAWGFDLDSAKSDALPDHWDDSPHDSSWMFRSQMTIQDFMVPGLDFSPMMLDGFSKRQGAHCGKRKNVIYRQLIELLNTSTDGDACADGEDHCNNLVGTSTDFCDGNHQVDDDGGGNGFNREDFEQQQWSVQQQGPFTTMLMLPTHPDPKEASSMLDRNQKGQTTQVAFTSLFHRNNE